MFRQAVSACLLLVALGAAGASAAEWQPEQPQAGRGFISALQGGVIYIDRQPYRITLRTRQGETLSGHAEAQWASRVDWSLGDEVIFATVDEQSSELDYLLRRLK